jgi:hypothetical protein
MQWPGTCERDYILYFEAINKCVKFLEGILLNFLREIKSPHVRVKIVTRQELHVFSAK